MKNFLKYLIATIVGVFLVQIIFFFIMIGVIAGLSSTDKEVKLKPNSVLKMTLDFEIKERVSDNPFDDFNFGGSFKPSPKLGLMDILKNLRKAAKDENIKGIYLDISSVNAGMGNIEELREALLKFKESGKFIVVYSDVLSQSAYYLASVSDHIYLNPEGIVEWKGLRSEIMFLKGALEKLGIEPQIIRHGKFKSAIEPYILEEMSPENREQTLTVIASVWNHMLKNISKSRGISVDDLNMLADEMKIQTVKDAINYKLIDGALYKDEFLDKLKELTGSEEDKVPTIAITRYDKVKLNIKSEIPKDKVAIVYAVGQIDMGKGDESTIGSDKLSETIREVRLDTTIKAMILRVNSPGGSALASEVIWREVSLTKKVKPVIISMGNLAASGGYYIACPADVIVANPTTITGSIGVFGVLWNGKELLNKKLGVTFDGVETNKAAGIGSMTRPMTAQEKAVIQESVERIYDVFIGHVSNARSITKQEVDDIGQGRIWSGINAKEIKLVDELGGIERAIEIAKEKANIEGEARIIEYPKKLPFVEQLLKNLEESVKMSMIEKEFGESYIYYQTIKNATKLKGIQARIPYDIEIY